MPMHNSTEYTDNYWKTSESLWLYYRDEPFISDNGNITDVADDHNSVSFKYKQKITGQTKNDGRNDVEIMVPLEYLSNFWRNLEMLLINFEINVFLTWTENCIIVTGDYGDNGNNHTKFEITDTKLYVPVGTLSAQDKTNYCSN